MKKNDRIEVQIDDLTYEGMGVAKVDGFPLFIENALPGEKVVAHVLKIGKKFGYAKVVEWVSTSPDRIPLVDPNGCSIPIVGRTSNSGIFAIVFMTCFTCFCLNAN